ncbi:heavy-metal-associated domain-containing protein [Paraoerskovia marina]|uniref:HMA domain-containing protein n=1 Tax=Paraoerskovia marina TaxID=545619 RepID=A0A1H1M3Q7_9CELL|nr:heavy-metal-associated domain-containing protein [Paraoerskovia marina]SDR81366.1 hypothetical protein SAMN04489860_0125 [Paraoerskovia marina]
MSTVTELRVEGITGVDEVARVQAALREHPEVRDVMVELVPDAPARVSVVTLEMLNVAKLRHAARDAGFTVVEASVTRDAEAAAFAAQAHARQTAHSRAAHVAD